MTVPLFNGGKRFSTNKAIKAQIDLLAYSKDGSRLKMMQRIREISERLFTLMLTLPMHYRSKNFGQQNFESYLNRYEIGETGVYELLTILDEQYRREFNVVESQYRFFKTYADLLHALGKPFMPYGSEADREFYTRLAIDLSK